MRESADVHRGISIPSTSNTHRTRRSTIATGFVLGLLLLVQTSRIDAAPAARIEYQVTREPGPPVDRYRVTLRFDGSADGTTTLMLPGRWASAEHAERGIDGLTLDTPDARLEDTDQPDRKRIVHRPGVRITVRYVLKQIAEGEPNVESRTPYLPVIRPGYIAWVGWTAWVVPLKGEEPLHVTVSFDNLPDDWNFASSFGLDPKHSVFDGTMGRFRSSIVAAGDFRLRSRPALGGAVITATRGSWPMRDGAFADRVATIVDGERRFWRDDSQPFFLVVLLPLETKPGWRSSVGTGLTDSFAAFVSADSPLEDLDFLWTHEYFHNWNNVALGRFEEPQADLYWFSEGFTDYYTDLLQLRWGMRTLEDHARILDDKLKSLAESPDSTLPNKEIAARFFTDRSVGRLPYLRGQFLAARWDAEIRAASGGRRTLDDLMRGLHDEHRRGATVLDAKRITDRARAEGVADPVGDVARQIDRGELPLLAEGTLGRCIVIGEATEPRFDWGFDLDASTRGKNITGVRVDGPAYAAGVRETQFLRSASSGKRVDREVEVGVQDAGQDGIRVLRYFPKGAPLTRQTATARADMTDAQRRDCLRSFGVGSPATQGPSQLSPMAHRESVAPTLSPATRLAKIKANRRKT